MKGIVEAYAPNANHASITITNGTIMVKACEWDGEKNEYIVKDILNAVQFKDGDMKVDGAYIHSKEGTA
jgi:hypothetical protein